jgi:aminoglycoside 6'-N-acetyltransferase I
MTVTVRTIGPGDRAEWHRMRVALWPDCPDEEHRAEIEGILGIDGEQNTGSSGPSTVDIAVFVADRPGGGLCGFLEAAIRPWAEGCEARPVGYIEGWYVDPDVRRHWIGRALVEAAEGWARSRGCRWMASDALIDNEVSIEAHARLGYREVERLVLFAKDLG